jgi:hypothetical protein
MRLPLYRHVGNACVHPSVMLGFILFSLTGLGMVGAIRAADRDLHRCAVFHAEDGVLIFRVYVCYRTEYFVKERG